MRKCEFFRCSNYKPDEKNNCLLYYNINSCSYHKDFECPVEKEAKRMEDYEAYDAMHNADGIVGKPLSPSKL